MCNLYNILYKCMLAYHVVVKTTEVADIWITTEFDKASCRSKQAIRFVEYTLNTIFDSTC